jgi:hypothetical protein
MTDDLAQALYLLDEEIRWGENDGRRFLHIEDLILIQKEVNDLTKEVQSHREAGIAILNPLIMAKVLEIPDTDVLPDSTASAWLNVQAAVWKLATPVIERLRGLK